MSKLIFVDFDKTLSTGEGEPHWVDPLDDEPREDMIELVNNLFKKGCTIVVYTARDEDYREETEYFLKKWDLMYHALRMEKPGFDLLIDNRAMSHMDALDKNADEIIDGLPEF